MLGVSERERERESSDAALCDPQHSVTRCHATTFPGSLPERRETLKDGQERGRERERERVSERQKISRQVCCYSVASCVIPAFDFEAGAAFMNGALLSSIYRRLVRRVASQRGMAVEL